MSNCELCGAEEEKLVKIKLSGAELQACDNCKSLGTILEEENTQETETKKHQQTKEYSSGRESKEKYSSGMGRLVQDYGDRIKEARENLGISIEELSNNLNEKASHIKAIENEERLPDNNLRPELEDKLGISLVEEATTDTEEDYNF